MSRPDHDPGPSPGPGPGPEDGDSVEGPPTASAHPGPLDLRGALHVAGHEVELLHAEEVADTAPALGAPHNRDLGLDAAASYQLRGMDADLFHHDEG